MQHCNSASSRDSAGSNDCNLLRCRSLDNFGMGTLARTYVLESLQTIRRVMPLLNIHFGACRDREGSRQTRWPLPTGCLFEVASRAAGARWLLLARLARADRTDG